MTYIVSGGALNSTHLLHSALAKVCCTTRDGHPRHKLFGFFKFLLIITWFCCHKFWSI